MRIFAEGLELEVRAGVSVAAIVAFSRERGVHLSERPWCGPVRLSPEHPAGRPPVVDFARLTLAPGPDARPRPGVHLAVVSGPDAGAVATVSGGLTIGRGANADLRLTDPAASDMHVRFDRSRVHDAGSTNGTKLGGARVRGGKVLSVGQLLELGETGIVLSDPAATPTDPTPKHSTMRAATMLTGAASMAVFALMTGHWPLALAAMALPAVAFGAAKLRGARRSPDPPVLDVTGTLGLEPLPPGPVCVRGPRGLIRAVTLTTGRPPRASPQWEPWMATLAEAKREVLWLKPREEPPSWAEVVVAQRSARVEVTSNGRSVTGPLPLVSEANADAVARRLASAAAQTAIPRSVTWGELPAPAPDGLRVRLGLDSHGPVELDLVADGPHVLVAGTTGSGKSEALRTIICSLAFDYDPAAVTFALIDFKGGAGLGPLARLPHTASVLSDLEPHLARRCLLALAAELEDRKRTAAASGIRSFEEWPAPPARLVVVIDEFQEIAAADRDFLPQLTRLAAQGRSLGVHLVLATQRPAGAVSADVRANISTTLVLRTASEAESRDLIGTPEAAAIPTTMPGRALLARGTATPLPFQIARPTTDRPADIRLAREADAPSAPLASACSARHRQRAPALWLPPLPERLAPPPGSDFVLGIADLPAKRSREVLRWDPTAGPLVVVGPPRSGRSCALTSVGARAERAGFAPIWVPEDARRAARTLALAAELPRALVLLDNAERTLATAATAEPEVIELLLACIRRRPVALVVPQTWASNRIVAGAGLTVLLTGLSAETDAAWGVPIELRGLRSRAGRARASGTAGWAEVQLSLTPPFEPRSPVRPLPSEAMRPLPRGAIGIGGDDASPLFLPPEPAAVLGPPGEERDCVVRRVAIATGHDPFVADSGLTLGLPGHPSPRAVVCVRPTTRALREVMRERDVGLVEPSPVPLRAVAIVDGRAAAVQVLPA